MLYFGGQAQAQMQSLSYTAKPKIIQTPDNQDSKSRLYVVPKGKTGPEGATTVAPKNDPLDLAARNLDENAKQEMDRVFELYKALSAQQNADAAQKPLKTEPTTSQSGKDNMHTLEPSGAAEKKQASPGGFAGILERYQQKKSKGPTTNSLSISDPKEFGKSGTPSEEASPNSYNQ